MRSAIIIGFLPWIFFFGFANGQLPGLQMSISVGLLCLFLFARTGLRKGFILDWAALLFFVVMLILGWIMKYDFVIRYNLFLENIVLAIACFASLLFRKPFSLQYAKTQVHEIYHTHPVVVGLNYYISFVWGFVFLTCSILIGLFETGFGEKTLMLQTFPTILLLMGMLFTIFFPDIYKKHILKDFGVSALPGISGVHMVNMGPVRIAYREVGSGPVVILCPDACMTMHYWDSEFLKSLSQSFRVILFDYPGIGYSTTENQPSSIEMMGDYLHRLVGKLQLETVNVFGYGLGGWVAQSFALKFPEKLNKLVLMATDAGGREIERGSIDWYEVCHQLVLGDSQDYAEKFLPLLFGEDALMRVKEKMINIYNSAILEGQLTPHMLKRMRELAKNWYANDAVRSKLHQLKNQVLLFTGKEDVLFPAINMHRLHELLKESELKEYDHAGHGVLYQYPHDIADQTKLFLSEKNDGK